MLVLLKALQSLFKTLHSEGTPVQIAAGFALGAILGLTPLLSLHNLIILALLILLNVSFGAGLLGMAVFTPVGFLLDPLFDRAGHSLLIDFKPLAGLWTWLDSTPVLAIAGFDNTVLVGSVISWLLLATPIFIAMYIFVIRYRAHMAPRVQKTRIYQAVKASQVYNVYRWFRP